MQPQVDEPDCVLQRGGEINFPRFMHMLYITSCKLPGSTVKGQYAAVETSEGDRFTSGKGEQSPLWTQLKVAFKILEEDFKNFDKDGDRFVDYTESRWKQTRLLP